MYAFLTKKPTTLQDTPDSPTSAWALEDAKQTAGKDRMELGVILWEGSKYRTSADTVGGACQQVVCVQSYNRLIMQEHTDQHTFYENLPPPFFSHHSFSTSLTPLFSTFYFIILAFLLLLFQCFPNQIPYS